MYLSRHPEINSKKKEPHYFGSDLHLPGLQGKRTLENYLSQIGRAKPGQITGEASVWYLYSKKAAEEIYSHNPDTKIIIMLREPSSMMYSLYNMFVWLRDLVPFGVLYEKAGGIKQLSFEEALATQDTRMRQVHANAGSTARQESDRLFRVFHTDAARYSEQVKRYLDVFPREQIHIILMDDFKANTAQVYRDTLAFLGVDPTFTTSFEVINSSRKIKSLTLHWLMSQHHALPTTRSVIKALVPRPLRRKLFRKVFHTNVTRQKHPPMNPETRAWLQEHFRDDVQRLATLIDRDLMSLWYGSSSEPAGTAASKLSVDADNG